MADRGQFGDMFGMINALFSAFAFLGIIYAIFLQKEELGLQRKELEQTREELRGQKEQLENQNMNIKHQQIESTIFKMIELHHSIVDSLREGLHRNGLSKFTGRDCFIFYNDNIRKNNNRNSNETIWLKLEHYFNNIYSILKYINDNSQIVDSGYYFRILKAQLSNVEIEVLKLYKSHGNNYEFNMYSDGINLTLRL